MFKIETNVPLPGRIGGRAGKSKYPFAQMQPGQMFWAEPDTKTTTLRSAIGVFQTSNPGYSFAVRTVEGKVGVWCTKAPSAETDPEDEDTDEESSDESEDEDTEEAYDEEDEYAEEE
jgi:hypothetical protein